MPVYLIRAGEHGPVKIGWADNVALRLTKMQADNHERLRVLRRLDGGQDEERALHRRFASHHLHGEWFSYSSEMLGDLGIIDVGSKDRTPFITEAQDKLRKAAPVSPELVVAAADAAFADRLRIARRLTGISQIELAGRVGIGPTVLCKYEKGQRSPDLSTLGRLAAALNCSTDWLTERAA